eukprot:Skav230092  [mRNA]  locus=scaffold3264:40338:47439:- [translate_table: standard]
MPAVLPDETFDEFDATACYDKGALHVEEMNIPGAKASTISVPSMWAQWTAHIFEARTPFSSFLRAQYKAEASYKMEPTCQTWPMPLPYHGNDLQVGGAVDLDEKAFRQLLNLQVAKLNFLKMGNFEKPPGRICGPVPLTKTQWTVVERLRKLSHAWFKSADIVAADMGRTAAKQQRQEETLATLLAFTSSCVSDLGKYHVPKQGAGVQTCAPHKKIGKVIGRVSKSDITAAQNIIASRIKMEGSPVFDPLPFLDDDAAKLYEHPFCDNISPEDLSHSAPRVRVHATVKEKIKLLELLDKSGRLAFRAPNEIKAGFGNGLFCVPKNLDVDRLILDGRPANLLQQPCNRFILTMGSAGSLLGLHLKPNEKLIMSGDDLSNFFYTFKVNYDRASRNFLDWKIPVHLVRHIPGFPAHLLTESFVYACLSSLAMGDSAACGYAQTSHIAMGLQAGTFRECELVTMHGRLPRTNFMAGIIIDDLVLMEKVHREASGGVSIKQKRNSMYAMYRTVQLEAHPGKGFEDLVEANFWGATVNGDEGWIRPQVPRAASLSWVCGQVARLGVCTVGLMEVLAGGFVAIFAFRRRMMSLLDLIYASQAGRDRRDVVRLSAEAIDELWSLAILCSLSVTDLRATHSNRCFMVDASNWGEAVVESRLEGGMADEIHRHGLSRSSWTKLLSPFKAHLRGKGALDVSEELPASEQAYQEHPLWEVAARGLQYSLSWKRRCKKQRHINIGEVRAYLRAEEIAGEEEGDVKVAVGGDSQVACGCICKGRSASSVLNRELRKSLSTVLGGGVYSTPGYVRSAHNPADDPTRGATLREPDVWLPGWWIDAIDNSFDHMGSLLDSFGLSNNAVGGYPPLSELHVKDVSLVDGECKSKLKRMHNRVRRKLRLKAQHKATQMMNVSENFPENQESVQRPWCNEAQDLLMSFSRELFILNENCCWPPIEKGLKHVHGSMLEKIIEGNSHSQFLAKLIRKCIKLGIHYWVENPHGSFLWLQPEWLSLPHGRAMDYFTVDYCTFKTPWRKRTRFVTSSALKRTKKLCSRDHAHTILRGKDKRTGLNMTALAEPYPKKLCALLAWHACYDTGCLRRTLVCRSSHRRIGEAKNPGPRRPTLQPRSASALDSVQLISAQTSALGERVYWQFRRWLDSSLSFEEVQKLFIVPTLMGYMLGAYGKHLYARGDALYSFRHLVVYMQREFPSLKGSLQPAWDVILRWEELEPVEHRRPLPFAMMAAMVCLAIAWGWLRIAGVILIGFHGCCRPGEVLRAQRAQLVLPCDLGLTSGPAYLRVQKPKPGRRGMGRIQHAKINDDEVVFFLVHVFKDFTGDTLLYDGTSSAFRLRWNKLLSALNIPLNAQLTPAGLRAGGTVELYRRGVPILDILWALRLKNVETLQHYLQEIATQITMVDLPLLARSNISGLSEMLPHFLRSPSFGLSSLHLGGHPPAAAGRLPPRRARLQAQHGRAQGWRAAGVPGKSSDARNAERAALQQVPERSSETHGVDQNGTPSLRHRCEVVGEGASLRDDQYQMGVS